MVWKCPPLNLFNWSNLWKWKEAMRDGGKGDAPRPLGVPMEVFDANFDAIFKKKKEQQDEKCTCKLTGNTVNCNKCPSNTCGR